MLAKKYATFFTPTSFIFQGVWRCETLVKYKIFFIFFSVPQCQRTFLSVSRCFRRAKLDREYAKMWHRVKISFFFERAEKIRFTTHRLQPTVAGVGHLNYSTNFA
jgi:hypothetical protein